jgi:hypothetical protein
LAVKKAVYILKNILAAVYLRLIEGHLVIEVGVKTA